MFSVLEPEQQAGRVQLCPAGMHGAGSRTWLLAVGLSGIGWPPEAKAAPRRLSRGRSRAAAQACRLVPASGALACLGQRLVFSPQPLNPNPDSRWNTYFKDNEVLLQIDKDVRYAGAGCGPRGLLRRFPVLPFARPAQAPGVG